MVPSSAFLISIYQCQAPRMQLDSRVCVYSRPQISLRLFCTSHTLNNILIILNILIADFCFLQHCWE